MTTLPAGLFSTPCPAPPLLTLVLLLLSDCSVNAVKQPCSDTASAAMLGHQHQQRVTCADRALQPCHNQSRPTGAKQQGNHSPVQNSLVIKLAEQSAEQNPTHEGRLAPQVRATNQPSCHMGFGKRLGLHSAF